MSSTPADLPAANSGPGQSSDELFEAVYARLKAMAGGQLASRERGSLNTTALVHELYLRVTSNRELNFAHPAQFFALHAVGREQQGHAEWVQARHQRPDGLFAEGRQLQAPLPLPLSRHSHHA